MRNFRIAICFLSLVFTFFNSAFSQNQQGNQYISTGIGLASNIKLGDFPNDEFDYIIFRDPQPNVQYKVSVVNRTYSPTLYISYSYSFHKNFTIGVTGAYENFAGDFKQDQEIVGNYQHQYLTIGAEGKYFYLNRPTFSLYGSSGLGCLAYFQNDNFPQAVTFINATSYHINGFISPIGMRFGKQLGGFIELGYGYKGIVNGGISYRL